MVSEIVARKLAAHLAKQWHDSNSLNALETDMLFQNMVLRRCCMQTRCLCPTHLSQLIKARAIEVSG
jgi:hypothetical protein